MNALTVDRMGFAYDKSEIFNNASLRAPARQITGLLGSNGSGKTTLFDIICDIQKPHTGSIDCGFENIQYLSQTLATPGVLTMRDIAKMTVAFSAFTHLSCDELVSRLEAWNPAVVARFVGLLGKKSSLCSYGEKRWFFTLTLLGLKPDLIILDEPTAGVDPEYRHYIWECLKTAASQGMAVLVSSHNIDEIAENCDGFYMISQKAFVRFDSGEDYLQTYDAKTLDEAFIKAARQ